MRKPKIRPDPPVVLQPPVVTPGPEKIDKPGNVDARLLFRMLREPGGSFNAIVQTSMTANDVVRLVGKPLPFAASDIAGGIVTVRNATEEDILKIAGDCRVSFVSG